jgi:hypothetical protein
MPSFDTKGAACRAALRAAPLVAILLVLSPYLGPLDHGPTSALNDIRTFQAPNVRFLASSLRLDGELPRWNPQDFGGVPLVGDPQAGVYNPVNWLLLLRPSLNSFGWLILASAGLGAIGFMRLASAVGCSTSAGAAGATAFVLGGKLLLHLVGLGHVVMAPFFLVPWVMLWIDRCAREPSAVRIVVASLLIALMLVWMHSQLLVYTALFLTGWGVLALARSARPWLGLLSLSLVATWSASLAAVHLFPIVALLGEFARAMPELKVAEASASPLAWLDLVTGAASSPESRYTVGGVTLLLAVLGLAGSSSRDPRRPMLWFCSAAVLAILLYSHGVLPDSVMARGTFRHPARALFVLSAPAALLVAFGVDALFHAPRGRRRFATGLGVLVSLACLFAADASTRDLVALAVAALGVTAIGESREMASPWGERLSFSAAVVLLAALGFDTGSRVAPYVRTAPETRIAQRHWGGELPPNLGPDSRLAEPHRHEAGRGLPELEKRRLRIESLTGYNSLIPWRFLVYASYASGFDPNTVGSRFATSVPVRRERPRLFDLLGVTHFLYAPLRLRDSWTWERATTALPRAYLAPNPQIVLDEPGGGQLASALRAFERLDQMDPHHQVLLHGEGARDALAAVGVEPGQTLEAYRAVPIRERRPNRISIHFETQLPSILVVNEPFFPGWRATDRGQEIPVFRANGLSRGLVLDTGVHQIEMEFRPVSWQIGWTLSLAALTASVLVLLRQLCRGRFSR